jgi:hypothetical protein
MSVSNKSKHSDSGTATNNAWQFVLGGQALGQPAHMSSIRLTPISDTSAMQNVS